MITDDFDDGDDEEESDLSTCDAYEVVENNAFVAVRSSTLAHDNFYICKVIEKKVAEEDMVNFYGHMAEEGERYIKGVYLERTFKESPTKRFYKMFKKTVIIHPAQIFHPAVQFNESDCSITMDEYQFICDMLYRS